MNRLTSNRAMSRFTTSRSMICSKLVGGSSWSRFMNVRDIRVVAVVAFIMCIDRGVAIVISFESSISSIRVNSAPCAGTVMKLPSDALYATLMTIQYHSQCTMNARRLHHTGLTPSGWSMAVWYTKNSTESTWCSFFSFRKKWNTPVIINYIRQYFILVQWCSLLLFDYSFVSFIVYTWLDYSESWTLLYLNINV